MNVVQNKWGAVCEYCEYLGLHEYSGIDTNICIEVRHNFLVQFGLLCVMVVSEVLML